MKKVKQILVTSMLALTLAGLFVAHILLPDQALSSSERRKLEQLPELTLEDIFSGDYFTDLEDYLLDQFPLREQFRTLKAQFQYKVLGMRDNNDIYLADGHLMKLEYPFKSGQAKLAIDKLNAILASHGEIANAYYALIPDKNYFLAEENGYPAMDYAALVQQAKDINAEYIDIFPLLSADDYYLTDSHWRQERIVPVAQALAAALGAQVDGLDAYRAENEDDFFGVYAGQSALPLNGEILTVLRSNVTDAAVVYSVEQNKNIPVYNWEDFRGMDPYDVYLSGAEAVLTMENPLAQNDRELVIFRDSFGSSIAPLLLSGYSKVTLVDIRYISSTLLDDYVSFDGADVLFLYNTAIFNAGATLK